MTLRESLKPFFETLSREEKLIALRATSHFILCSDYREYRERIKPLSKPSYDIFYRDVRNFVKSSFECRKIWRAVRHSLSQDQPFLQSSKKFQADLGGMTLVWKALPPEDQDAITASSLVEDYGSLDVKTFTELVQRLDKYCGKVSYLKLRFLADNDPSLDLKDLRGELLTHGVQAARLYEHTKNLPLIENYSKASIQNHAINLIQHFTSESRACVKNTTVGCGTCIFCLTDKPQRCPHAVADYRATAISLDGMILGAAGLLQPQAEEHLSTVSFLEALKTDASPELIRVVDLVFGSGVDDKFEGWLSQQHTTSVDELSQNPKRLVKLLCQYLDLPTKEIAAQLRTRYESYRKRVA